MRQFNSIILLVLLFLTACGDRNTRRTQTLPNPDSSVAKVLPTNTVQPVVEGKLKYCIHYDEANSWENVAEKYDYNFQSYSHKNKKYLQGKRHLTNRQAKLYLFDREDSVAITNIWSNEVVSKENVNEYLAKNEFYLTDTIASKPEWTAFLVEKIEVDGSQRLLVTVDKNGKLISKTQIAFYYRSGSYTSNDGSRPPWFALKTACIYDNLTIKTDDNQGALRRYAINDNGYINELK